MYKEIIAYILFFSMWIDVNNLVLKRVILYLVYIYLYIDYMCEAAEKRNNSTKYVTLQLTVNYKIIYPTHLYIDMKKLYPM